MNKMAIKINPENLEIIREKFARAFAYVRANEALLRRTYGEDSIAILGDREVGCDCDPAKLWIRINGKAWERGDADSYAIIGSVDAILSAPGDELGENLLELALGET
jgi:hypothetical protein